MSEHVTEAERQVLGAILINALPWSNKIGLLFALWLTGASWRPVTPLSAVKADPASASQVYTRSG